MKNVFLITISFSLWSLSLTGQQENLEVEGAIQIGNNNDPSPDPGTIRWSGSDFEGWNGTEWLSLTGGSVICDIDGNSYKTKIIGSQIWMIENLRTRKYCDGSIIDYKPLTSDWQGSGTAGTGAWCWSGNISSNEIPYGKLYNWHAVNTGKLCPAGWHVPTDTEWTTLIDYLDPLVVDPMIQGTQSLVAGGKMKASGLAYWDSPNTGATNESGFSGLPGGLRNGNNGNFLPVGLNGYWWSSTESDMLHAWYRSLNFNNSDIDRFFEDKKHGFSIRCIKD